MLELLFSLLFLLAPPDLEIHFSTIFASHGDKHMGGESPCLKRLVRPTDNIIAHRTLKCHTRVRLYNPRTKRHTIARVGDHGPYGACIKEGWIVGTTCPKGFWRVKKREHNPGTWRGAFDLTPHVAKNLGHNGFEIIIMRVLPDEKKHRRKRKYAKRNTKQEANRKEARSEEGSNEEGGSQEGQEASSQKEGSSPEDPSEGGCANQPCV